MHTRHARHAHMYEHVRKRVRVPHSTFVGGCAPTISLRRLFVLTACDCGWRETTGSRGYCPVRHTVKRCRPLGVNVFVCARRPRVHNWGYSVPERWQGDRDGSEHAQRRLGLGSA